MTQHPTEPGLDAPGGGETAETDILAMARSQAGLTSRAIEDWYHNDSNDASVDLHLADSAAALAEQTQGLVAEVERLRAELADACITVHKFQQEVGADLLGLHENCGPDEVAGAVTGMRLSRDAWRENAEAYEWTGGEVARLRETEIAPLLAEVERLKVTVASVRNWFEWWNTYTGLPEQAWGELARLISPEAVS